MSHRPDAEEAASLQYQTEHVQPDRNKSVIPYLVLLVGAALALLLMAYLMQQRTAESVEGLNQSVNSFQTIDQLVEENRTLREEAARLQEELSQSEDQRLTLESQLRSTQSQLAQAQAQLDLLLPPEEEPSPTP